MYDIGIPENKCLKKLVDVDGTFIKYEAEAARRPLWCQNRKFAFPHR